MNRRRILAGFAIAPAALATGTAQAAPAATLPNLSGASVAQLMHLVSDIMGASRVFPDHPALRDRLAAIQGEAATRSTDCAASRGLLDLISEARI